MDELRRSETSLSSSGVDPASASLTPPARPTKPILLSKQSSVLAGDAFAREPECSGCTKSFNILRRRHHCRGCHVAICKDCGRKAVDKTKGDNSKPQWYCLVCLEDDDMLEVVGAKPPLSKRLSFSSNSLAPSTPQVACMQSAAKFCIECGNELPAKVKFCIECGASVRPPLLSPGGGERLSLGTGEDAQFASRNSRSGSTPKPLVSIDEHAHLPAEGEDDEPERDGKASSKVSASESDDAAAREQMLAVLMAENEKLKAKLVKMKQKVVDAEQRRVEAEQREHQLAATAQANGVASTEPPKSAPPSLAAAAAAPETPAPSTEGVKAKDHPDYAKFFKLLSMGLPAEQVKMKMAQAGVDGAILDDPDKIIGGAPAPAAEAAASAGGVLVKDDEKYAKFFTLLKMGMPVEQIKLKMGAEGLDPNLLDTPDAVLPGSGGAAPASSAVTTVKEDPDYEKFFKLLRMGMPAEQIKMKMSAAGLNPDLLDTPDAPSPNQKGASGGAGGVLAGLPPRAEAVKVDPSALKASLASSLKKSSSSKKPEEPQLPKKEAIKPNVELRPLFWTRVPVNVVSNTLWIKLNDTNTTLDVDEMEWMFRKNPVEGKKADDGKKKKEAKEAQPQQVLLLDPKRQQNVAIAIARFKMSASDMKDAIYALDHQKVTSEMVNVLISIAPSVEEQDLLKNYDGDLKLLGNVEKFFLELLSIPRYTQRIKCMRFKMQFESRILETQAQLDALSAATDQIADSAKFRRVLEHILAIGNYLNGSTPRGGAYGFKLDTLTKLHTLKSVDPRVTLMNFLLRQLEETAPEVIAFAGELPHIGEAKRLSLDQLRADINSYNAELAMLQGQVRASKNDNIPEDMFYREMAPFAKEAVEVLDELSRDFSALEGSYNELVASFGEDPRKVGPTDFFAIIEEFVDEFKKAYRQNQTKEIQAIWEAAKQAREEAIAAAAAAKAAAEAEEEARRQQELEENARLEEEKQLGTDEAKALYASIINMVTAWAENYGGGEPATVIDQFKSISRQFGVDEISAADFCAQVRRCVGSKTAVKIIPVSAKLLSNAGKRKDLLIAFDRFVEQVKQEKDDKKKQRDSLLSPPSIERSGSAKPRRNKLATIRVEDIEPVVGEAAQQLHKSILEQVHQAVGGDSKKMKTFTSNARKYGSEQISAREFYQYLTATFEPDFVGRLVPDLARLLQDAEKRHALIRALCESAPGWEKFSGL
ncbi:TPA: hypothetical protein N0F65_008629 [Lagenidium giganteum]|uniref:Formin-like protein n=1 Tax=Lagenidium giganteum TaxID=4803 RepID=A0AAV2YZQ2_9STRA|nr:TPA: hypothetical protein N0F65_008629 [Lagenidium giganteum]